jgi:cell division protein FtsB
MALARGAGAGNLDRRKRAEPARSEPQASEAHRAGGPCLKPLIIVAGLVAAAALHAALDADAGIGTWLRLRGELRASQERNQGLRDEIEALEAEALALERGGFALERAIREELGFTRPGETLLRLLPNDPSSARFP